MNHPSTSSLTLVSVEIFLPSSYVTLIYVDSITVLFGVRVFSRRMMQSNLRLYLERKNHKKQKGYNSEDHKTCYKFGAKLFCLLIDLKKFHSTRVKLLFMIFAIRKYASSLSALIIGAASLACRVALLCAVKYT